MNRLSIEQSVKNINRKLQLDGSLDDKDAVEALSCCFELMRENEELRKLIREVMEDYATAAKPWNAHRSELENRMIAAVNSYKESDNG